MKLETSILSEITQIQNNKYMHVSFWLLIYIFSIIIDTEVTELIRCQGGRVDLQGKGKASQIL